MKVASEIGYSVACPSVFCMLSTTDCEFEIFFCFFSWRLLLLTDEVFESEVPLTSILQFSLRKMGVSCLDDGVDCDTVGSAVSGWLGGASIGIGGLKCNICVKSGQFVNASSCFVFQFGISIFSARATLLDVEIHERP